MTLLTQGRYRLSTRTGVVLGPDDRPVGRIGRHMTLSPSGRARYKWCWRAHDDTHGVTPTRAAALAALTAHLDKETT